MQNMGDGSCPFEFNFDEKTFKPGDTVSYRVSTMDEFPFMGELLEVHDDYVVIAGDPLNPETKYRGTRESRPLVDGSQI
ncbi:MAG: hypothetical protein ABI673_01820 [Novosphingobium sp.]